MPPDYCVRWASGDDHAVYLRLLAIIFRNDDDNRVNDKAGQEHKGDRGHAA